jgi:hypothetical protein
MFPVNPINFSFFSGFYLTPGGLLKDKVEASTFSTAPLMCLLSFSYHLFYRVEGSGYKVNELFI